MFVLSSQTQLAFPGNKLNEVCVAKNRLFNKLVDQFEIPDGKQKVFWSYCGEYYC